MAAANSISENRTRLTNLVEVLAWRSDRIWESGYTAETARGALPMIRTMLHEFHGQGENLTAMIGSSTQVDSSLIATIRMESRCPRYLLVCGFSGDDHRTFHAGDNLNELLHDISSGFYSYDVVRTVDLTTGTFSDAQQVWAAGDTDAHINNWAQRT